MEETMMVVIPVTVSHGLRKVWFPEDPTTLLLGREEVGSVIQRAREVARRHGLNERTVRLIGREQLDGVTWTVYTCQVRSTPRKLKSYNYGQPIAVLPDGWASVLEYIARDVQR